MKIKKRQKSRIRNTFFVIFVSTLLTLPLSVASAAWPLSDSSNNGGWKVNNNYTDEYNGSALDNSKWFNYHTYWSGRNPSQFDPSNVWVSNGTAKLRTKNESVVKNGSFENGSLTNWSSWGTGVKSVSTMAKYRDTYGVMINGQGAVTQIIQGLQSNTTYKISGWAKRGTSSKVSIGVKNYGGVEKWVDITNTTFELGYLEFTTGASSTSAEIYFYNSGGSGTVYGDEISVVRREVAASGKTMLSDNYITSAVIQSKTKAPYGYYEVRAKVANDSHTSSFWLQGSYSEIDVMEAVGNSTRLPDKDTKMPTNTHDFRNGWQNDVADPYEYNTNVRLADGFHTYGIEWNASQVKWYFDGQLIRTKQNTFMFEDQYLFLDTEIFEWDGLPLDGLNSIFEVDYIRAWNK